MTAASTPTTEHRVVSRDEWLRERIALLAEEKELTRRRDALAGRVRGLPWVRVEKSYTFDAPTGRVLLAELFGAKSQLIAYHFMFDPTWSQGCKSCSFIADHYNGIVIHLAHRDIAFVTVSKAPVEKIEEFRARMGWTFPWVSGANSDFGRDFGVSFTDEELAGGDTVYNFNRKPYPIRELPGLSVFAKDARGDVFHTYAIYGRGLTGIGLSLPAAAATRWAVIALSITALAYLVLRAARRALTAPAQVGHRRSRGFRGSGSLPATGEVLHHALAR
jgi:predicted dithiol-disulfide oxidoreductase (DUF899 family)